MDYPNEIHCGQVAARMIARLGGEVTFAQYDEAMKKEIYFAPLHWAAGWGSPATHQANTDKMCVFQAVKMRLVEPIDGGYRLLKEI